MKARSGSVGAQKVFVVGDNALVAEFSLLCASKGYFVQTTQKILGLLLGETQKRIQKVQTIPQDVALAVEVTNLHLQNKKKNLKSLDQELPPSVPILSASVTSMITEQAGWIKHRDRLMGFCALPGLFDHVLFEVATSVYTSNDTISRIKEFLWSLDREISVVQDRVGMVLPRIACMLVNEAAFAVMENVAQPEEIDLAMELGTNYPQGPLKMGQRIGFDQVLAVLDALCRDLGGDRYRAAPLLRQLCWTRGFWGSEPGSGN